MSRVASSRAARFSSAAHFARLRRLDVGDLGREHVVAAQACGVLLAIGRRWPRQRKGLERRLAELGDESLAQPARGEGARRLVGGFEDPDADDPWLLRRRRAGAVRRRSEQRLGQAAVPAAREVTSSVELLASAKPGGTSKSAASSLRDLQSGDLHRRGADLLLRALAGGRAGHHGDRKPQLGVPDGTGVDAVHAHVGGGRRRRLGRGLRLGAPGRLREIDIPSVHLDLQCRLVARGRARLLHDYRLDPAGVLSEEGFALERVGDRRGVGDDAALRGLRRYGLCGGRFRVRLDQELLRGDVQKHGATQVALVDRDDSWELHPLSRSMDVRRVLGDFGPARVPGLDSDVARRRRRRKRRRGGRGLGGRSRRLLRGRRLGRGRLSEQHRSEQDRQQADSGT